MEGSILILDKTTGIQIKIIFKHMNITRVIIMKIITIEILVKEHHVIS